MINCDVVEVCRIDRGCGHATNYKFDSDHLSMHFVTFHTENQTILTIGDFVDICYFACGCGHATSVTFHREQYVGTPR